MNNILLINNDESIFGENAFLYSYKLIYDNVYCSNNSLCHCINCTSCYTNISDCNINTTCTTDTSNSITQDCNNVSRIYECSSPCLDCTDCDICSCTSYDSFISYDTDDEKLLTNEIERITAQLDCK